MCPSILLYFHYYSLSFPPPSVFPTCENRVTQLLLWSCNGCLYGSQWDSKADVVLLVQEQETVVVNIKTQERRRKLRKPVQALANIPSPNSPARKIVYQSSKVALIATTPNMIRARRLLEKALLRIKDGLESRQNCHLLA